MKEWIGYYENILPDDVSNGIMNISIIMKTQKINYLKKLFNSILKNL